MCARTHAHMHTCIRTRIHAESEAAPVTMCQLSGLYERTRARTHAQTNAHTRARAHNDRYTIVWILAGCAIIVHAVDMKLGVCLHVALLCALYPPCPLPYSLCVCLHTCQHAPVQVSVPPHRYRSQRQSRQASSQVPWARQAQCCTCPPARPRAPARAHSFSTHNTYTAHTCMA